MWRWLGLLGMAILAIFACIGEGTASAKDIRFIAHEPAPDRAIWAPSAVTIDQKNDLKSRSTSDWKIRQEGIMTLPFTGCTR